MNHTHLPIIGTVLFSAGILILLILLLGGVRRIRSSNDRGRPRYEKRSELLWLSAILTAVVFVFAAELVFWVSGQLRSYQLVHPGEALCSLDIYTPADRMPRLIYSTVDEEGKELVEVFPIRDAHVRLTGESIEWPSWLSVVGLGKFFKLTKVEFMDTDSLGNTSATFSTPIHQGSMSIYNRLSGWPEKLAIAYTESVQTPVFTADSNNAFYDLYVHGDKLVLK